MLYYIYIYFFFIINIIDITFSNNFGFYILIKQWLLYYFILLFSTSYRALKSFDYTVLQMPKFKFYKYLNNNNIVQ